MKNSPVLTRFIRGGLLFLLLGLSAATAAELTFVRVYTGWRDAASFKRISEYFTGRENTGGEAVLRTHADQRAGFYFLVRVTNPAAARTVTARLGLISAATAQPVTHTFTTPLKAGDTVFHLGLTGPDWPDAKAGPVAWKLDLTDDTGRVLATEQSYLWEKPATP
ncbi:hypothetical protein Verru16b_01878 [Lacunisphaera limnophila]|uniref:Uncharacterized protein n=1 Tax=Lacunisphaera limnophila TaxID=1838286 RepID=A0A1D8AV90_9BACT|nr:hypothetical protein [Lacunisphaera limnophila]AOS44809.1 hypothetical protein Verru16b_01878 [Lacunisphaera limnophila]